MLRKRKSKLTPEMNDKALNLWDVEVERRAAETVHRAESPPEPEPSEPAAGDPHDERFVPVELVTELVDESGDPLLRLSSLRRLRRWIDGEEAKLVEAARVELGLAEQADAPPLLAGDEAGQDAP